MEWTDEKVAQLKKLWDQGYTASEIAREMHTTRNTICGKVARLGMKRDGPPQRRGRGSANPDKAIHRPKAPKNTEPKPKPKKRTPQKTRQKPYKADPLRIPNNQEQIDEPVLPVPAPAEQKPERITVLNLTGRMCRWPSGTPGKDDFSFCGKPRDGAKPYCTEHAKLAWAPKPGKSTAA